MWGFEAYAEGLSTTPNRHGAPLAGVAPQEGEAAPLAPPRYLWKKNRNNYLFDAQGKLLGAAEVHNPTIWRTHHAFSARCALVSPTVPPTGGAGAQSFGAPGWAEQAWTAYQSWAVGFRLSSTATDEPHILLSVAPAYFPNLVSATGEIHKANAATLACLPCAPSAEEEDLYNKRMLETPLIWEEPYALSVECTTHGVFLWSDHWGIFGRKIADRCLEVRQGEAKRSGIPTLPSPDPSPSSAAADEEVAPVVYDAALRLRWSTAGTGSQSTTDGGSSRAVVPTLSVELKTSGDAAAGGAATTREEKVGEELWQHLVDLPLSLDEVACKAAFRPYVTLMEGGDSVELL
ncbi:conserved hypothetical protein [Leishmania mexicana MHOM/GT/2001/U1103]|uniref:Uncharacterized protein n=1 Tax=Leishmania mexicana (strain MHOM/GT/2001/U1103) TaxID=929439 RepID=E9B4V2_LEIMU|nr:conserved hypothetical protein [Leishmania mexicana MHOM/GT/2001/U1103]CBZ30271.1 conserved hypothetical protein [Leishmania mexicana MHOM/GT/2001/U1103]